MTAASSVDLNDLFDAWDKESGGGRDAERARAVADAYVAANPTDFDGLRDLSLEQLVEKVDKLRKAANDWREAGLDDEAVRADSEKLKVDVWLLHHFEPQSIGGGAQVIVRLPNG